MQTDIYGRVPFHFNYLKVALADNTKFNILCFPTVAAAINRNRWIIIIYQNNTEFVFPLVIALSLQYSILFKMYVYLSILLVWCSWGAPGGVEALPSTTHSRKIFLSRFFVDGVNTLNKLGFQMVTSKSDPTNLVFMCVANQTPNARTILFHFGRMFHMNISTSHKLNFMQLWW